MTQLSQRQHQRRARILSVTRALVGERGARAVTTRLIAEMSGVAEKTIFNIYGSKDRLIAAATFDRSEGMFVGARAAAGAGGWRFLQALADGIVELTLAEPEIARALVPLLIDPAGDARLDALYDEYVGRALGEMIAAEELNPATPVTRLVRLIRIGFILTLVGWTSAEIADGELAPHFQAQLGCSLLPFAIPPFAAHCRAFAVTAIGT